MRVWFVFIVAIVAIFTEGCSGGGSGNTAIPTTSSPIRLTLNWSARSRTVAAPGSALSATVTLPGARASGGDLVFTVNRSSDNGNDTAAHSETYTSPEEGLTGSRRLNISFFAATGGTGSVVATASATVRIGTDGQVLDTITNIQKKITTVQVQSGQSLNVGEQKFLSFTARDADGAIVAVSPGSAQFALTAGSDLLSLAGIVGQGLKNGTAQVSATVDGVTSAPETVTILAPVKIAYVANGQNPSVIAFLQVLQARNITPTVFTSIPDPATLQNFDVLLIGSSGNIGTADAPKVKAFLDTGRGVVLVGYAPALLAQGTANLDADLTPIAAWFGNVRRLKEWQYIVTADIFERSNPGSFPLPAGINPGQQVYSPIAGETSLFVAKDDIQNPLVDAVATGENDSVFALAYELPSSGSGSPPGRVYWQWDPRGQNSPYTERVISLFLAGTNWTARR